MNDERTDADDLHTRQAIKVSDYWMERAERAEAEVARLTAAIAVLVDLGDDLADAVSDDENPDYHRDLTAALDAWENR